MSTGQQAPSPGRSSVTWARPAATLSALGALLLVQFSSAATAASRRPLQAELANFSLEHPNVSVKLIPKSGDFVIRYVENGKTYSTAYEPPHKVEVTVLASVAPEDHGFLFYSYSLESSRRSRQGVSAFWVYQRASIHSLRSPFGWTARPRDERPFLSWYPDFRMKAPDLLPGAVLSGLGYSARSQPWLEFGHERDGRPKESLEPGALPGVVACYAIGTGAGVSYPTEGPDVVEGLEEALHGLMRRPPYDGVSGLTIGPTPIPLADGPRVLLERLSSYAKLALAQGWLESLEVYSKYEAALSRVELALRENDRHGAAEILKAIAGHAVIDLRANRITSEAQALLKYNAEFLIRWIEQP